MLLFSFAFTSFINFDFRISSIEILGSTDSVIIIDSELAGLKPLEIIARGVGVPVHRHDEVVSFVSDNGVKLAILCVPGGVAQEVANELVEAGVQGILNFSPTLLEVPEPVTVNNVDLALELENLSYFVTQGEESEGS